MSVCVTCKPSGSGGLLSGSRQWAEASGPRGGSGGAWECCDPRGPSGRHSGSLTSWPHVQVQLTDFENSAYVVFVVLLTRVILSYKLDFLIPLSKVRTVFSIGLAVGIRIII